MNFSTPAPPPPPCLVRLRATSVAKRQRRSYLHLGGVVGKHKGRVGDAPLVGCGGYANEIGAAAATGVGELIIKITLAREVVYNMENGQHAQVI